MSKQNDPKPALLTRTEIAWLLGEKQVSKAYEYYLKHSIKEKLQTLTELELPLLRKKRLLSTSLDLSVCSKNLSANSKVNDKNNKLTKDFPIQRDWSSGQDIGFPSQLRGFESRIPHQKCSNMCIINELK